MLIKRRGITRREPIGGVLGGRGCWGTGDREREEGMLLLVVEVVVVVVVVCAIPGG
jgi:hypothetical protein